MTLDIFSSFDDHNKVIFDLYYIIWVAPLFIVLRVFRTMWINYVLKLTVVRVVFNLIKELVRAATNRKEVGGALIIPSLLFCFYVLLNLWGLVPYVFSTTRHLAINLSIGLIVWIAVILMSILYRGPAFFAHLLPAGSPGYLAPFLCVIELFRLLVRPLTLSVRLTANLTTGHILIGLLGLAFSKVGLLGRVLTLVVGLFYHIFEFAVCFIQAYIFVLLSNLYNDEHPFIKG